MGGIVKEFVLRYWDPKEKIASIDFPDGTQKITDAVLIYPTLDEIISPSVGDKGLAYIGQNGKTYILGFIIGYDESGKYKSRNKTLEENCDRLSEGDKMFFGGQGNYFKLGRGGDIEVFASSFLKLFFDPTTGTAKQIAKNYTLKTLSASLAADGNVVWEFDPITGMFKYHSETRATANDFFPRFTVDISPTGKSLVTIKYDNLMPMIPMVTPALPVLSTTIRLGVQSNQNVIELDINGILNISLNMFGEIDISTLLGASTMKFDKTGGFTVKTGKGIGALSMTAVGDFEFKNPIGTVKMSAAGGIKLKGISGEVLAILSDFMSQFVSHIHPTGTGPSGPATTAPAVTTAKAAKLQPIISAG